MMVPDAQRGFTLIELLIAMALTVLIGAMSYRFLDAAIAVSEQGKEILQQINEIDRVWLLLAADLEQASSRAAARPAVGLDALAAMDFLPGGRPAMLSQSGAGAFLPSTLQRPGALLWFVRAGWSNPWLQQRSELQRVAYRVVDGSLYRDFWPERNQSLTDPVAGSLLLLKDVEALSFRFLAVGARPDEEAWLSEWPPAMKAEVAAGAGAEAQQRDELVLRLPAAIEVRLLSGALGDLRRIFLLPGAS